MLMQPCCYGKIFWNILDVLYMFPSRIIDSFTQHRYVGFICMLLLVADKMSVEIAYFQRNFTSKMDKMLLVQNR